MNLNLMKIAFLMFVSFGLTTEVAAVVCQNKTAIVYSNGMFNTERMARDSLYDGLRSKMVLHAQTFSDTTKYDYVLAFASGGTQFVPQVGGTGAISRLINAALALPNIAGQVAEVVWQKMVQDDFSAFWRWLAGQQPAGSRLQKIYETIASGTNSASYIYDPDLQNQVTMYKTLLNSGKRVVIVSHSQGNFYANAAYSQLILTNSAWANSIGNVQVATPTGANLAGKLGNNEPHITVPEDLVMKAVRLTQGGPLTLPTKPAGILSSSPNIKELSPNNSTAWKAAVYGHHFVKWYLAGTYTRNLILKGITDQLIGKPGGGFGSGIPGIPPKVNFPFSARGSDRFSTVRPSLNYCSPNGVYYEASIAQGVPIIKASGISTPNVTGGAGFVGFVPIPNGVGELYVNSQYNKAIYFDSSASDFMYIGATNVTLKSNTWDTTSRVWATSTSTVTMPSYTMTVTNFACSGWDSRPFPSTCNIPPDPTVFIVPISIVADYSAVVSHTSQLYDSTHFYRLGAYNATAVMSSKADDNHFVWKIVTVDNGVLSVRDGGVITPNDTVLLRPYPAVYRAVVDIGLSTNQFLLTKTGGTPFMGLRVVAYNDEVGLVFLNNLDLSLRVK